MTTAEDDPYREHESQAEAPAPADETPAPLRKAAVGMAEAQAWKGQKIAKGWRKLVNALRRREEGGGTPRPVPAPPLGGREARPGPKAPRQRRQSGASRPPALWV